MSRIAVPSVTTENFIAVGTDNPRFVMLALNAFGMGVDVDEAADLVRHAIADAADDLAARLEIYTRDGLVIVTGCLGDVEVALPLVEAIRDRLAAPSANA